MLRAGAHDREGRRTGFILAAVSAAGFSTLGLFAKLIYSGGFSVPQSLAWRFTLAFAILFAWLVATGGLKRPWGEYRTGLLLGLFGFTPQAGLYFLTVRYLNPGLAGLLLYLYPAFVVGMSCVLARAWPGKARGVALALGLAGCALTFWTRGSYPLVGYAFGLAVAVTYAAYLVASDHFLAGLDPRFATACLMFSAGLFYWIVTIATGTVKVPHGIIPWSGILGVSVVGTVFPIVTLFAAMKRIGAADASLVSTVEPVLTVALSALLLGERFTLAQASGGALIVAGVLVLNATRMYPSRPAESRTEAAKGNQPVS